MDCIEEGLLQMYIDGAVSQAEQKQIEHHLETCEDCQLNYKNQKAVISDMMEAINFLAEPSEEQKEDQKTNTRRLPMKSILYAITAASVLLIGFAFFKNYNKTNINQPEIYYELDWSVDANKPITDQEFIINMYNTEEILPEIIIK